MLGTQAIVHLRCETTPKNMQNRILLRYINMQISDFTFQHYRYTHGKPHGKPHRVRKCMPLYVPKFYGYL